MIKIDFNKNWKFRKAGTDRPWRKLCLPHDAMLEEKRDPKCESGSAGVYFPGGIYEYEKEMEVSAEWADKKITIEFEGIYGKSEIWVNERYVGKIVYGYTEARFDLTDYLYFGAGNKIYVRVDNHEMPNSRWYTGSGIYRPVTLYVQDQIHIQLHGIKVNTISYNPARIAVSVAHARGYAEIQILDGECVIAAAKGDEAEITLPGAKLWDDETPDLYRCRVFLTDGDKVVDTQESIFGIRMVEWSPQGLFINGKETLLRGGCLHHDNGIVGACAYDESEERRVRIMKENGFNAIRSAHNPCSRAMLDACDKLGMYVMDETWDMWYQHKSKYDYATEFMDNYKEDIRTMVEKDYNHPSVIMYSIGNEVSEPAKTEGKELAKEMIELCHKLDGSRAVTAGINLMIIANAAKGKEMYHAEGGINTEAAGDIGGDGQSAQMPDMSRMDSTMFNSMTQMVGSNMNHSADGEEADCATSPILDMLDIAGYNYASGRYTMEGKAHPDRLILGSETFPHEIGNNWKMVKQYPYLIGDFMWTAFDYLGEAGIGAWSYSADAMGFEKPYPWLAGGAGVIDLTGNPDGEALYARTVWGKNDEVLLAVTPANHPGEEVIKSAWRGTNAIPSWSWRGCEGNAVTVEAYTEAPHIRLYLNEALLAEKDTTDCKAIFEAEYRPGVLKAVGTDEEGNEIMTGMLKSAAGNLQLSIQPEKEYVQPGEILYVAINICDKDGIVESNADELISIEVQGGELLGFGSARQRTEESFLDKEATACYGRTLAAVRVLDEQVCIAVKGVTLPESSVTI